MSRTDNVIRHVLSEELLHQFDLKLWYKYITAFIESVLFRDLLDCSLMKFLSSVHHSSDHFLQMASERILEPGLREPFDTAQTNTYKHTSASLSPTGWIKHQHIFFSTQKTCRRERIQYFLLEWRFLLDAQLSTNFTFDKTVLPVAMSNAGYIFVNYRSLSSQLNRAATKCPLNTGNKKMNPFQNDIFVFSGWHPEFSFYPPFKVTYLSLCLVSKDYYNISIFSSVMDKSIIESIRIKPTYPNELVFVHCFLRFIVQKFNIVGFKLSKIILVFQQVAVEQVTVFDGPIIGNKILSPKTGQYMTSTFQCLIIRREPIYTGNTKATRPNLELSFSLQTIGMKLAAKYQTTNADHLEMTFPSTSCSENPCLTILTTDKPHRVNVTILMMKVFVHNSFDCGLHGITIIDKRDIKQEISLLCAYYPDTSTNNGRSIYSASSEAILLIYWYICTTKFYIKLQLAKTMCSVVYIDPCIVQHSCLISSFIEDKWCWDYLHKLNLMSTLKFFPNEVNALDLMLGATLSYIPSDFNCSIIHISQSKNISMHMVSCKINLMLGSAEGKHILVHHDIRSRSGTRTPDCFLLMTIGNTKISKFSQKATSQTRSPLSVHDVGQTRYTRVNISGPVRGKTLKFQWITFSGKSEMWYEFVIRMLSAIPILDHDLPSQALSLNERRKRLFFDIRLQARHHYVWLDGEKPSQFLFLTCQFLVRLSNKRFSLYAHNPCLQHGDGLFKNTFEADGFASLSVFHMGVPFSFLGHLDGFFIKQNDFVVERKFAVTWNGRKYQIFQNVLSIFAKKCRMTPVSLGVPFCLNFTIDKLNQHYLFFGKQIHFIPTRFRQQRLVKYKSWMDAFHLCEKHGAYLPVFTSKYELEHFIALMKVSEFFPHIVVLYVGLIQEKVCILQTKFPTL